MKNRVVTSLTIIVIIWLFVSCGNAPQNTSQQIEKSSIIERYESNGWVTKYYNQNWELVYDTCHYTYYRVAFFINDTICKDSIVTDYYKFGQKQFEGFILAENPNKLNKKCIWYYPNGNIEKVAPFVNGELAGQVIQYYDNGQIKNKYTVVKGNIHGKCLSYYEDGQIESDKNYNYGKANGRHVSYYPNGKIKAKISYLNDALHGSFREYYSSGSSKTIGSYNRGEKNGTWTTYDESGYYTTQRIVSYRVGARCCDGSRSYATGRGACSHHGGVDYWLYEKGWATVASGYTK